MKPARARIRKHVRGALPAADVILDRYAIRAAARSTSILFKFYAVHFPGGHQSSPIY